MAETLTPHFLDRKTIAEAYPLLGNTVPGMTVDRWAQFVRSQPVYQRWPLRNTSAATGPDHMASGAPALGKRRSTDLPTSCAKRTDRRSAARVPVASARRDAGPLAD
jgi:hypothetical protein